MGHDKSFWSNEKVSDGSQPPMAFDLSLSESAGSRSLDRLLGFLSQQSRTSLWNREAENHTNDDAHTDADR